MTRIILLSFILCVIHVNSLAKSNVTTAIRTDWLKTKLKSENISPELKLRYLDSLVKILPVRERFGYEMMKGDIYYSMGKYRDALRVYEHNLKTIPDDSVGLRLMNSFHYGLMAMSINDFRKAMRTAFDIVEKLKPDSLKFYDFRAYCILIDIFKEVKDYKSARRYVGLSLDVLRKTPLSAVFDEKQRQRCMRISHRTLASIYLLEKDVDRSYEESRKFMRSSSDPIDILSDNTLSAQIAEEKGEYSIAENLYREALAVKTDNFNKCIPLLGYMQLLLKLDKDDDAIELTKQYKNEMMKIPGSPLERKYLGIMRYYYHKKGDYRKESELTGRMLAINDSLQNLLVNNGLQEIVAEYENIDRKKKMDSLMSDARKKSVVIIILSAIIVLSGIFLFFIIKKIRKGARNNDSLERRIEHITREHVESIKGAEESLEEKNRKLSSMTMHMARLNEALVGIENETGNTSLTESERLEKIRGIVKTLEREENVWEMFSTYFEQVNQSFFNRLPRICPTLTKAETRMCAFILLNLTSKEIAILTNRSTRTIDTIKYNLRKKLDITEPTETFLRKLASINDREFEDLINKGQEPGLRPLP